MQQVQYNYMCITLKHNLRIECKFGHRLILSISTKKCHKNSISKSQNGPLSNIKKVNLEVNKLQCIVLKGRHLIAHLPCLHQNNGQFTL